MAQKNQREFTLHMSEDMLRKFIFISEKEGRTPNNQFLFMLRNSVAYYEKTKGRISQAELAKIAPYDEAAEAYVTAQKCTRDFRCMSSLYAPDLYYGIFTLGEDKCVVYFEATEKILKIMKYYNIGTVIVPTTK